MSVGVVILMMLMILSIGAGGGHSISIALKWKDDRKKLRAGEEQKPEPEMPNEFESWDTELIRGLSDERIEQVFEGMSPGQRTVIRKVRNGQSSYLRGPPVQHRRKGEL